MRRIALVVGLLLGACEDGGESGMGELYCQDVYEEIQAECPGDWGQETKNCATDYLDANYPDEDGGWLDESNVAYLRWSCEMQGGDCTEFSQTCASLS